MNYSVLHTYDANVTTVDNPYNFEQRQLFNMALRINKKRRFLFVSKVLGKHLAVDPAIPLLTSHLLSYRFMEARFVHHDAFAQKLSTAIQKKHNHQQVLSASRKQKLVPPLPLTIIGFAETATALGHGFFEKFSGDVQFVHTTREHLVDVEPVICFEEEHSHASSHRVYADESIFLRQAEVVLVDDEMTTGKTNGNIIRQLHETYPHLKSFTLVTILDFRTDTARETMQKLADELGIEITCVSLFTGAFQIEETGELFAESMPNETKINFTLQTSGFEAVLQDALMKTPSYSEGHHVTHANYYRDSGRFALTVDRQQQLDGHVVQMAEALQKKRSGGPCLVLGTGEFMYVPMSIAAHMGNEVYAHATTRSPIYAHEQSLIYNKLTFPSAEFPGVTNFLYNIPENTYADIFIIYERIVDREAAEQLAGMLQAFAQTIHVVTLGGVADAIST